MLHLHYHQDLYQSSYHHWGNSYQLTHLLLKQDCLNLQNQQILLFQLGAQYRFGKSARPGGPGGPPGRGGPPRRP